MEIVVQQYLESHLKIDKFLHCYSQLGMMT